MTSKDKKLEDMKPNATKNDPPKVGSISSSPAIGAKGNDVVKSTNISSEKISKTDVAPSPNIKETTLHDDPTEPEKKIPVIKLIAPNLKETESLKASDIKVNLENVKEQSLEKPIPISEPINKIKEKLFDLKPKETEQGL